MHTKRHFFFFFVFVLGWFGQGWPPARQGQRTKSSSAVVRLENCAKPRPQDPHTITQMIMPVAWFLGIRWQAGSPRLPSGDFRGKTQGVQPPLQPVSGQVGVPPPHLQHGPGKL